MYKTSTGLTFCVSSDTDVDIYLSQEATQSLLSERYRAIGQHKLYKTKLAKQENKKRACSDWAWGVGLACPIKLMGIKREILMWDLDTKQCACCRSGSGERFSCRPWKIDQGQGRRMFFSSSFFFPYRAKLLFLFQSKDFQKVNMNEAVSVCLPVCPRSQAIPRKL